LPIAIGSRLFRSPEYLQFHSWPAAGGPWPNTILGNLRFHSRQIAICFLLSTIPEYLWFGSRLLADSCQRTMGKIYHNQTVCNRILHPRSALSGALVRAQKRLPLSLKAKACGSHSASRCLFAFTSGSRFSETAISSSATVFLILASRTFDLSGMLQVLIAA